MEDVINAKVQKSQSNAGSNSLNRLIVDSFWMRWRRQQCNNFCRHSNGTMSGTAVKGPVAGATVTAYGITNGIMGAQLASGTTDSRVISVSRSAHTPVLSCCR